ncbi:hypothetical protein MOE21_17425 [Bacillus atrophaeus]|uniref:hypothetical protein n=1 Tax=Bacillus atrophaeus TaxID=1452 RepID=UPI002282743F|nr:hypothetical protein [Bacillus atrophaeus]MCY8934367.1 hypothetical protein [Bacillus atrophaeus]
MTEDKELEETAKKVRKKRITQREIGFIQGVAYSVAALLRYDMDAKELLRQSGITIDELKKYVDNDVDYNTIIENSSK